MLIEVKNGIGVKRIDATGYYLKVISEKGLIQRIDLVCNGNIIYTFVNEENLPEFSDNNINIPLIGILEIRLSAADGIYSVLIFLEPYTEIKSIGYYKELLVRK